MAGSALPQPGAGLLDPAEQLGRVGDLVGPAGPLVVGQGGQRGAAARRARAGSGRLVLAASLLAPRRRPSMALPMTMTGLSSTNRAKASCLVTATITPPKRIGAMIDMTPMADGARRAPAAGVGVSTGSGGSGGAGTGRAVERDGRPAPARPGGQPGGPVVVDRRPHGELHGADPRDLVGADGDRAGRRGRRRPTCR